MNYEPLGKIVAPPSRLSWPLGTMELHECDAETPQGYAGGYLGHGIVAILQGCITTHGRRMDGKSAPRAPCRAGESNFFPAGTAVDGALTGKSRWLAVHFNQSAEEALLALRSPRSFSAPMLGLFDPVITSLARELERQIVTEEVDQPFVEASATLFLTQISRLKSRAGNVAGSRKLSVAQLGKTLEHIEENLHRPVTLQELAAPLGISLAHFSKLFKNTTGRPPHKYILERRVDLARTLLEKQQLPISTIAYQVGFNSQSHLTTQFRRIYGMTPFKYRCEIK